MEGSSGLTLFVHVLCSAILRCVRKSVCLCRCDIFCPVSWYLKCPENWLCSRIGLQGSRLQKDSGPLKTGPVGCPEMSVRNYQHSPRSNTEERGSLQHGSEKCCWFDLYK